MLESRETGSQIVMAGEIRAGSNTGPSLSYPLGRRPIERPDGMLLSGVIMALLIVLAIVGMTLGAVYLGGDAAAIYILLLLVVLGAVGLFALVAMAVGFLRFVSHRSDDPLL